MNALRAGCAALAIAAACAIVPATAGVPSLPDCLEGSDFIANAARARDNGMPRDRFLTRMQDDFEVIRAFPPSLRWFAKDRDDERFLLEAAARVFDRPKAPATHHAEFLALCLERVAA